MGRHKSGEPTRFPADVYRTAAEEHVRDAYELFERKRFVLAHYVAGLAVECMLHAYKVRRDSRAPLRRDHNLRELAKEGHFDELVSPQRANEQERYGAALGAVVLRWRNDHRYRSEEALRRKLKEMKLDRGVKGDYLKESSRQIVDAALYLVMMGGREWSRQGH